MRYALYILVQSVVYGIGNPLTKIAYESITPFWCLTFRFALAFFIFLLFFGRRIRQQVLQTGIFEYLPASLCMAGAYITCNLALKWTTATNVGFLIAMPVVFAPLLSRLILRRKYSLRHIPALVAVLAGLYLLCGGGGGFQFGKGDLIALVTAVCLAGGLVFGEKSLRRIDAVTLSALQAGMTALISLACALLFDDLEVIGGIRAEAWGVVVFLAIACTFVAYIMQNLALAHLPASTVSMLQCTQPILTAIFSFFLLGESLSAAGAAGALLILFSIMAENLVGAREAAAFKQAEGEAQDEDNSGQTG